MRHIFTSIDIGTDTIKVVVCELFKSKLNLLAASSVKSKGIKKGLITDFELASTSVREAIKEVEGMLGIKISKVIASVPSYLADFTVIKGKVNNNNEDKIITSENISNVIQVAVKNNLMENKEMVTILPIDFKLDDGQMVSDPKGLISSELDMRAVMVTTPRKNIYSVVSLLENIGLEVIDISLNSIGDIYSFKNQKINSNIGAVVNIGSETTTVSIYNKGIVVKSSIIGIGGKSIDNDIAYMYKIDNKTANKLKEKFALAHKKYASVSDLYDVNLDDGTGFKVNQFEISEIVMSRVEEILLLAKKEINILTNKEIEYIIVTGGTSNMAHFEYMIEEILGKNAKVGNINLIGVRNNKYSSSLGNIIYFIEKLRLKGKDYTMINNDDIENLSSIKKNLINISNESMLGKVFGYFFGE